MRARHINLVRLAATGVACLLAVAAVGGCSSVKATYLPASTERYNPTYPDRLVVSMTSCPPDGKIIGSVVADVAESERARGRGATTAELIDALKSQAGAAGADGICQVTFREGTGSGTGVTAAGHTVTGQATEVTQQNVSASTTRSNVLLGARASVFVLKTTAPVGR